MQVIILKFIDNSFLENNEVFIEMVDDDLESINEEMIKKHEFNLNSDSTGFFRILEIIESNMWSNMVSSFLFVFFFVFIFIHKYS